MHTKEDGEIGSQSCEPDRQEGQCITCAVASPANTDSPLTEAWREFFRIGDEIAALDTPESETLTAAVLAMRR